MSLDLGTLSLTLTVDDRLTPGLNRSKKSVQGLRGDMSKGGKDAGNALGDGFASTASSKVSSVLAKIGAGVAALGLINLGKAGLEAGFKTAMGMEKAEISFTTMLGSAEKSGAFLQDLQQFAAKTPFEFPELQTAAGSLISIGIDANKVIPIMTTLGNVTSGMGTGSEGVKRATVAIQQMNAAGKITAEDLNQLRDAGVPVYDLLAGATGKTKEELAGMAANGKLGRQELDQLMAALESGKGLEKFNGLMDAQSQSLEGMISTSKDTLNVGLAEALTPLLPLVKQTLGWLTEVVLPVVVSGMKAGAQAVANFVDGAGPKLHAWALVARDALAGMDWEGFADGAKRLGGAVMDLVGGFAANTDELPSLTPLLDTAAGAVKFFADHIDLVIKAIPFLIGMLAAWKAAQAANNLLGRNSAIGMMMQIGSTLALAASNRALVASQKGVAASAGTATAAENISLLTRIRSAIATGISTAASWAARGATMAWAGVQWLLNAALSANPIGLVIIGIVALVAAIILAWKHSETFRNVVMAVWGAIKAAAMAVVDWFINSALPALQGLWNGIVAGFIWLKDLVVGAITFLVQSVVASFNWWRDTLVAIGTAIWNGIVAVFNWLKDGVIGAVRFMVDTAIGMFNFYRDVLVAVGTFIWHTLVGVFNFLKDGVIGAIRFLVDTAIGMFHFYRDTLIFIGTAIWNGLVGIFNFLKDGVIGAVRFLVDSVVASFNWWRDTLTGIATTAKDWILGRFNELRGSAEGIFRAMVDGITRIWDGIKAAASHPVRFVIETVLNNGILAGWNKVADFLKLPKIEPLKVPGFRDGGYTGNRGESMVSGVTHGREYVLNAKATRKLPRPALDYMNATGMIPGTELPGYKSGGYVWPVPGYPQTRGPHGVDRGVDIAAPMGTPVVAAKSGVVTATPRLGRSYGHHIKTNTGNIYAHLSQILAQVGQQITAGQRIGSVGSTGNSTGPHLHFVNGAGALIGGIGSSIAGAAENIFGGFASVVEWVKDLMGKGLGRLGEIEGSPFGKMVGAVPRKLVDGFLEKAKTIMPDLGGDPGGEGVERWRGLVAQVLGMVGLPVTPAYIEAWLRQIKSESGGNPRAIQGIRDVNSGGNEAAGLVQVIPGTFAAYRSKNLPNDRLNPAASLFAGMNYAKNRYGVDHLGVIGHGHGYAKGALSSLPGVANLAEGGAELVINPQMRRMNGEKVLNHRDTLDALRKGNKEQALNFYYQPNRTEQQDMRQEFNDAMFELKHKVDLRVRR